MGTKQDLANPKIPKLEYCPVTRTLKEWSGDFKPFWAFHHTVKQQILKRHPELYQHLKLVYFPPLNVCIKTIDGKWGNPHLEADAHHSGYEERWGIPLSEVIYLEEAV